ncbi:hypothetical protein Sjap_016817 [Stephania japonica]|uniref:AMP-dependent synthetase/ligase domain-containing protein n=1 Tax=Stephania japonica TaxID=461633 RepID=A0AAP0NHQ7_9MAGN
MVVYTVKVEEARVATEERPSAGPVYRSIYANNEFTELPDQFNSPWDFFSYSVKKNPKNRMLGHRSITNGKAGPYVWLTYQEVFDEAVKIGSAVESRGIGPGGRCGIYGSNCPEWIIAMEACNSRGMYSVPLYDTLGRQLFSFHVPIYHIFSCANAVEFIINHAEVSVAFVQENKMQSMLACLSNCASLLKTIVSFGLVTEEQKKCAEECGVSCFSWKEFVSLGTSEYKLQPKEKGDTCTIMYTSGTTGDPKGVLLTNEAVVAEVFSIDKLLQESDKVVTEWDTYFSFLPLAHIFDQIIETYCIYKGASIGFWQGDIRYLVEDIHVLKPTIFCAVPRVFDRIYTSLTESCAGCFTSIPNVFSMVGTVGVPVAAIEARLESVPEMGYDSLSGIPRGEICLRGNTLFSGYCKRQDLTDEVLVDSWFHTGDIGEWQPNGAMKIIDRKKNIFKLSQGEYIAVENLENTYNRCPIIDSRDKSKLDGQVQLYRGLFLVLYLTITGFISLLDGTQIWVYGNSFKSFLVAVAVPNKTALEDWAETHNESGDYQSLCANPRTRKYILDELNITGKKHKLRGFEMLKAIHLEPNAFNIERDLITPTFKLKRPQLLKYYEEYIDQLYNEAKGGATIARGM